MITLAALSTDDFSNTTATSGTVQVGGQVTGTIEVSGDEDWFKVSLIAGTRYLFDLRGEDGKGGTLGFGDAEANLELLDSRGNYTGLIAHDGGTGGDPLMSYIPVASGTYYLEVSDLWRTGTGTYTLGVSVSSVPDDYASTTATTGALSIGGQITGNIELPHDDDWFKVSLIAGNTYLFNLRGSTSGGGTLGTDSTYAQLLLYQSFGPSGGAPNDAFVVATAPTSASGADPALTYTPRQSGTYYLSASEFTNVGTGTYTLTARALSVVDDYPGANTTTGLLGVGGQVTGAIEFVGDEDWFKISLLAGQAYWFELRAANAGSGSSGTALDASLTFFNENGSHTGLRSSGSSASGILGLPLEVNITGTYFVSVAYSSQGVGSYSLSLSRLAQPDTQIPTAILFTPADEATGVNIGSNISITFSESIQRGTGNIVLKTTSGSTVATYDSATSNQLSIQGSVLTINPASDLAYFTGYQVEFAPGSIKDLAGNNYAGGTAYNFETTRREPIVGTAASDFFSGGGGVRIDGLAGIDTVSYSGNHVGIVREADGWWSVGSDALKNVERLKFDDQSIALDLDGHAGMTARILGAVFGASSIGNSAYVGIGLNFLDAGMSYERLMQLALDTRLGLNASHSAVVTLLYSNVVGVAPGETDLATFVALLDAGGQWTPASLGTFAADHELNAVNIGLVGLEATGIPFIPFAG